MIELIEELYKRYPQYITNEINDLDKLTDEKIVQIVNKIPDSLLTILHKEHIISFLKERKKMLKNIIDKFD